MVLRVPLARWVNVVYLVLWALLDPPESLENAESLATPVCLVNKEQLAVQENEVPRDHRDCKASRVHRGSRASQEARENAV